MVAVMSHRRQSPHAFKLRHAHPCLGAASGAPVHTSTQVSQVQVSRYVPLAFTSGRLLLSCSAAAASSFQLMGATGPNS